MTGLIERVRDILARLDLAGLKGAGIWPGADYELIFNYPPYQTLQPIRVEEVYGIATGGLTREAAVYLHFPFCDSICSYCHYARWMGKERIQEYLEMLQREAEQVCELLGGRIKVQSLHVGGGTPSLLSSAQLLRLMADLRSVMEFGEAIEMTIEGNPSSLNREWLEQARELGFNRLNIGVQTLDDRLLKVCRRSHSRDEAIKAIELAGQCGFDNVNVDLIFGLPGQSLEDWEQTMRALIELEPASVTCYKLRRKEKTLLGQVGIGEFPTLEEQLLMHIMAIELFSESGWQPWHFETLFVREPRFRHRHQEYKWGRAGELLGLGVSAYSYLNGCVSHTTNVLETKGGEGYLDSLRQGCLPNKVGRRLSQLEQMHRWVVLGLMRLRVEQKSFEERFGVRLEEVFSDELKRLMVLGLVEVDQDEVRVAKYPGLLFPMEIMTQFYTPSDRKSLQARGMTYGSFPAR